MATISDVADRAGVSVKTVSRVLNNYEHISARTRQKVEEAMRELSYAPSSLARQIQLGDSLSIGIVYGDPSSGYQAKINHAMLDACRQRNRYLAVEVFDESSADWVGQVEGFLNRTRVQNMVLVPPICDSSDLHRLLSERRVNYVLISPSGPSVGASAIVMDDRRAAREMTSHLIGLGHRRIGHIGGHPGHIVTLLRRQGYEEALHRAGIDQNPDYVAAGDFSFKKALSCAEAMLSLQEPPTAIFAANDEMAAAVLLTAHRFGLRVPEDLSVAGFDDTPIAKTLWPELTTVAQPFDAIAKAAIESLEAVQSASQHVSETLVLEHDLIIRGSTAAPL